MYARFKTVVATVFEAIIHKQSSRKQHIDPKCHKENQSKEGKSDEI